MSAIASTLHHRTRPARLAAGRAASVTAGGFVGLLVGLAVIAFVATRLFGFALLAVNSDSMAPAIRSGDAIVVRPVAPADIEVGDVILFQSGGDLVPTVHRVVGINEIEARVTSRSTGTTSISTDYRFATRGDGNPTADQGLVSPDRILGRVWFTVPNGGRSLGVPAQTLLFACAGVFAAVWAVLLIAGRSRRRPTG